ncbi:hypothetical protein [Nostoc sp.]
MATNASLISTTVNGVFVPPPNRMVGVFNHRMQKFPSAIAIVL